MIRSCDIDWGVKRDCRCEKCCSEKHGKGRLRLNLKEAAEALGMTDKALRAEVARRRVPYQQRVPGSKIYFIVSELEEWLRRCRGVSVEEVLKGVPREPQLP